MINCLLNYAKGWHLLLCMFLLLAPATVISIPFNNLYESRVAAAGQEPSEQSKLIQQAFRNVLVQVCGTEKILGHLLVLNAINKFDNYVVQFSYQQTTDQNRMLSVRFDEKEVNELVRKAHHPILGKKRNPVVLWVAIQNEGSSLPQWVGVERSAGHPQDSFAEQLEVLAKKRGLTLVFPLFDLTDSAMVSEQNVWNNDLEALQTATTRYNSDTILVGKISKQPSGWYADWTLVEQGAPHRWDISNSELSVLLTETMDTFAVRLAGREQERSTEHTFLPPQEIRLIVSGVQDAEHYVKVTRYLKTLPAVSNVEVAEISPLKAVFNIKTTVKREALAKSIAADQLLLEDFAPHHEPATDLTYKMAEAF
jgi:hypothetical protein